jgi:hypothetical protein
MKIAIIGSGHIGGTIGKLWAQVDHHVRFSSRHPENLDTLLAESRCQRIAQLCRGSIGIRGGLPDLNSVRITAGLRRAVLASTLGKDCDRDG